MMAVQIIDQGRGNRIELSPWFESHGKLRIRITGDHNEIKIPEPLAQCGETLIQLGSNCTVSIGSNVRLADAYIMGVDNAHLIIAEKTTFTFQPRFLLHEPSRIQIGADCMIASNVQFMTSDMHTVFDMSTLERINHAKNIEIGDHVWIGLQSHAIRGATIEHDAIVGMRSVVNGSIPAHSLAAGSPAMVKRINVGWDRKLWQNAPEEVDSLLHFA